MKVKSNHMDKFFSKVEPTLENMNSISEFNKIVKNYLNIVNIENGISHNTAKRPKRA